VNLVWKLEESFWALQNPRKIGKLWGPVLRRGRRRRAKVKNRDWGGGRVKRKREKLNKKPPLRGNRREGHSKRRKGEGEE